MLTDVHAHICDPVFDKDREDVLKRAREAGVSSVIAVGETLADAQKNLTLAEIHPEILPAAGLYPTILDMDEASAVELFIRKNRQRLVAIGEIGLDYWKVQDEADREIQREIFKRFIELGKELDLPLNIHSRSAGRQVIELLLEHNAKRVILHAFDGKASTAAPAVEAGYFFSIPPSIIRSRQKQKLTKRLPLSSILVETDSPVLGPDPEKRNEPVNALMVTNLIAELRGVTIDEVMLSVDNNYNRLFSR
ncbi:TatD family hydrolase [bacterium]|nr:TatD family hydrolase [bacterium]